MRKHDFHSIHHCRHVQTILIREKHYSVIDILLTSLFNRASNSPFYRRRLFWFHLSYRAASASASPSDAPGQPRSDATPRRSIRFTRTQLIRRFHASGGVIKFFRLHAALLKRRECEMTLGDKEEVRWKKSKECRLKLYEFQEMYVGRKLLHK